MPRTVIIVDDHPFYSHGFEAYLRTSPEFSVLPSVAAVEQVAAGVEVCVCDLRLPGRSGADAIRHLVGRGAAVLACSGVAMPEEVLDVIAAGANGYIDKKASPEVFVTAVGMVARGARYLSAELAQYLLNDAARRPLRRGEIDDRARDLLRRFEQGDRGGEIAAALGLSTERLDQLIADIWRAATHRRTLYQPSPRERQVIILAARGKSHKEIADELQVSGHTVVDFLKSIRTKFVETHPEVDRNVAPMTAARLWASELGLD